MQPKPLSQFLQISGVHSKDKLLTMDVVDVENMIFMKDDLVSLMQSMESSFVKRVVHDAFQGFSVTLGHLNPEILTPTT